MSVFTSVHRFAAAGVALILARWSGLAVDAAHISNPTDLSASSGGGGGAEQDPDQQARLAPGEQPGAALTLFCFVVMMRGGYEEELISQQFQRGVGVFRCEDHLVFSDYELWLAAGEEKTLPLGDIHSHVASWGSFANTASFLKVWESVIAEGSFRKHPWTAKVDPDSVFLPARLIEHLRDQPRNEKLYLKNWRKQFGFLGPIEVLSRDAVEVLGAGLHQCEESMAFGESGEDGYMQACLEFLGIGSRDDFNLLDGSGDENSCYQGNIVVFHAYKSVDSYFNCLAHTPAGMDGAGPGGSAEVQGGSAEMAPDDPVEEGAVPGDFCCMAAPPGGDPCGDCYAGATMVGGGWCGDSREQCRSCGAGQWCTRPRKPLPARPSSAGPREVAWHHRLKIPSQQGIHV